MPRIVKLLSDLEVRRLKDPGLHCVSPSLYLQITPSGTRSYIFRYRFAGKHREMGIGSEAKGMTLAKARQKAADAHDQLRAKVDPIDEKRAVHRAAVAADRATSTFKEVAEAYIRANAEAWSNPKHKAQWASTLEAYVFDEMGPVPVGLVETAHVVKVLEPIWATKTETASRVRGRIEKILDYAKASGMRAGENPARWKGHLDQVLPARGKLQRVKHHEALPYKSLPSFRAKLEQQAGMGAIALQFLILTCARTNEVLGAKWGEIDLKKAHWIVPAARMKAGREWRVPLSSAALEILTGVLPTGQVDPDALVFPADAEGTQLSNMVMLALCKRMGTTATPHGFRSTFRDWVAETQHVAHEVAEMALAHAVGSDVELAYRRGDMFDKRRAVAESWAEFATRQFAVEERAA